MAYVGITEKAKIVRNKLKKELGYTNRQVSVRGRYCGYSAALDIVIKDFTADIRKIRSIAYEMEDIDYDEASGEILSGGNTYVHVEYDYKLTSEKAKELIPLAEKIFNKMTNNSALVAENGNKRLVYFGTDSALWFIDDDTMRQEHINAYNSPEGLARAIVGMIYERRLMDGNDLIVM